MRLTLFDLDHTLLDGDSDQLWCEFLMDRGELPREPFETLNRDMARAYAAGEASAQAFCDFYIGTLAGRSAAEWHSLRRDYIDSRVVPRIPAAAMDLVARHRDAGDLVLLTTATCRFLSELTAVHLGIRPADRHRMRDRRRRPLHRPQPGRAQHARRQAAAPARLAGKPESGTWRNCDSTLYSDSINDLPLLGAVRRAVAVDPDARLAEEARQRGWPVISLR